MTGDERIVLAACGGLLVLPVVPLVVVGWLVDGGAAAADGLCAGFSAPVLFAVTVFGVVLGGSLRRPQPPSRASRLGWAGAAAAAHVMALVGAIVLDAAATTGAGEFVTSLHDGSLGWTVTAVLVRSVLDLRAPLALVLSWIAVGLAARRAAAKPAPSRLDLSC